MDPNSHSLLALIALILTILYTSNFWKLLWTVLGFAFRFALIYALLFLARPEVNLFVARMEQKAEELHAVLKNSNLSIDTKVTHILGLKSDIKQKNVPEGAVPPIFECLRLAIASPYFALITAGFSTLGHFLKRLFIQELHNLVSLFAKDLISCLLDRLGDHKDRIRALAAQALTDIWPAAPWEVEHSVFELGLASKNPRTKQSSLVMLATMVTQCDLTFKQYVPEVVASLEHADSDVREAAKQAALELFRNAPPFAKTDLRIQMADKNVRKPIANEILVGIGLEPDLPSRPPSARPPSARPPSRGDAIRRPPSRGDAIRRPPSRGDALHRPPSRANVLHNPPSRVDSSHSYPASCSTSSAPTITGPAPVDNHSNVTLYHPAEAVNNPPLTFSQSPQPGAGPARTVSNSASGLNRPLSVVSAHSEQPVEDSMESAPGIVRPMPTRPGTVTVNSDKAPRVANASVDRRCAPATPRYTAQHVDDNIQPRHLASAREFEQIVREMLPCFEGKEDETNWQKREKSIIMLRRITHGNAPHDFTQAYLTGIKTLFDPIFKVANSLRTTMQTTGLQMLQSLARVNQTRLDPMIDIILSNAMKLCGNSKKITSQNGNLTVETLLENVTRNSRVLGHITSAATSTNNSLRLYSAGWLRIVINGQAKHKTTGEGVTSIAQCIKAGVSDARPENRESYRLTYWEFHKVWPDRANQILNEILPKHRVTIEKDAANPMNDPFVTSSTSTTGLFSSTPGRPTAKGAITTKGKASLAAPKNLPPTMAAQPAQPVQPDTTRTNPPRKKLRSAATGPSTSSLSSAPMRPGASKPRAVPLDSARPATATGFHPKHTESPLQGSPTRIPVAQQSTPLTKPLGLTRPRQKSDPLQNASPTKIGHKSMDHQTDTPDRPFGTINIPKRRTNNNDSDMKSEPLQNASLTMIGHGNMDHQTSTPDRPFGTINIPKKRTNSSDGEVGEMKSDENIAPKKGLTGTARPRVVSITEALKLDKWPGVDLKEILTGEYQNWKVSPGAVEAKGVAEPEPESELPEPSNADEAELYDTRTSYPDLDVVANQLQVEDDTVKIPEVSPATTIRPVSSTVGSNIDRIEEKDTDVEAIARRVSISAGTRRVSIPLPEWPKSDHKPDLQPGGTPPLRPDDEMLDVQDDGLQSEARTPDFRISRALRPFCDRPDSSEATPIKRDISLRSQDPVRAREMIVKGIERIKTRDMDMTGYRKLQGLIEFHDAIFTDEEQFGCMLTALLDELVTQAPPSDRVMPFGSVWDFKTQVLYTVKYMFLNARKYFSRHYPGTVLQLLEAQKPYEIARHLVKIIDQLIDAIVEVSEPSVIVHSLLGYLPNVKDDPGHKILRKGFEIMGHALVLLNENKTRLPEETLGRIGELATDSLKLQSMGVRRRIIAMCVELRVMVADEDQYWKILGSTERGVHGLLFYYKSKQRAD
ncbi:clasp N terminal-domain-containing protein [Aspergillus varians]